MEYNNEGMMIDPKMAADANFAADFEVPKVDLMGRVKGFDTTSALEIGPDTDLFKNAFSSGNIGSTMQGIGAIAGAAAGIYDARNKKKYQDKIFGMEEKRVARETARQDKQQAAYDKVFG